MDRSRAVEFEEAALAFKEASDRHATNYHNWLMRAASVIRRLEMEIDADNRNIAIANDIIAAQQERILKAENPLVQVEGE